MLNKSQPFGKKCQKTSGGYFFDSHCSYGITYELNDLIVTYEVQCWNLVVWDADVWSTIVLPRYNSDLKTSLTSGD